MEEEIVGRQGRYRKTALRGQDALQQVWDVIDEASQTPCRLCVIRREKFPVEDVQQLDDRWFPTLLDAWHADGMTYLVTRTVTGQPLSECRAASEKTVVRIFLALCDALRDLHRHRLVHRNLRLSNILLTDGSIQIVDVSCVKRMEEQADGTVAADTRYLGTIGYAAPEQFGSRPTDVRSDIYTVGIIIRALLQTAFHGKYRGPLNLITKKCTEYDPTYRFQTLEELADELKHGEISRNRTATFNKKWTVFYFIGVYFTALVGEAWLLEEYVGISTRIGLALTACALVTLPLLIVKCLHLFHAACKRWMPIAYVVNAFFSLSM